MKTQQSSRKTDEQKVGFASEIEKVRAALIGCAEKAAGAGQSFAEDMGMTDEHVMFRALPQVPIFNPHFQVFSVCVRVLSLYLPL